MSSITGNRVRKQPAERRTEIAAAAQEIALADGLAAVTLRAVAGRLAVAPALVAHYVPSMDELRAQTVDALLRIELARFRAATDAAPTGLEALRILVALLFESGREPSAALWLDAWSHGMRVAVIEQRVRAQMDAWQEYVSELLLHGDRRGEFTVQDADAVAWQLIALADGLNAHSLVHYRSPVARQAMLAAALEKSLGLPTGSLFGPAATQE